MNLFDPKYPKLYYLLQMECFSLLKLLVDMISHEQKKYQTDLKRCRGYSLS